MGRTGRRWGAIAVLAAAVALAWVAMGGHPSFGSSVRYSEAAREMVETGDWLFPRLHYAPYFEKPPLTYWLGAGSIRLLGVSWHAAHLGAAIATLASVLCAWGLARGLRGGRFPLAAAFFFLGGGAVLVMSTVLTTDPVLSAALALAWLAYSRHDRRPQGGWIWAFWAALGLGVLAKGPVAIALAASAVAGFHLCADGPLGVWRALWRMRPLRGTALLLAINLPWWLAVWWRDPRLIEYFLVRYNWQAFLTDKVNHTGPLWLYPAVIAAAFAPWNLPVLAGLAAQVRMAGAGLAAGWSGARPRLDRRRLFLVCGVVFPLLFLSVSRSKLGTYVQPLFPLVALLAFDALWRAEAAGRRWPARWFLVQALLLLAGGLGAGAVLALRGLPGEFESGWLPWFAAAAGLLLAGQAMAAWWAWRGRGVRSALWSGGGLALAALLVVPVIGSAVPVLVSSPLAAAVARAAGPDDLIVVGEPYQHDYHLPWGLGRRLTIVTELREVGMGHFVEMAPPPAPIPEDTYELSADSWQRDAPGVPANPWLLSRPGLIEAWGSPRRIWLFCGRTVRGDLERAGQAVHEAGRVRKLVLLTNHPLAHPLGAGP